MSRDKGGGRAEPYRDNIRDSRDGERSRRRERDSQIDESAMDSRAGYGDDNIYDPTYDEYATGGGDMEYESNEVCIHPSN